MRFIKIPIVSIMELHFWKYFFQGLVVPVLRNVQDMNYADIEKGIAALGEKAKKNQLAVEDMDGGTFTISNGGVFGSLFGTPIINPPQSAILGMHGTFERPVVRNGQVSYMKNSKFIFNFSPKIRNNNENFYEILAKKVNHTNYS